MFRKRWYATLSDFLQDHTWLMLANERREQDGKALISEQIFEEAIDLFEKESHFEV